MRWSIASADCSEYRVPNRPTVSVIIPTHNRVGLLMQAVASVRAQTWSDWELIIVDDGSTDGTASSLAQRPDPRIQVHSLTHSGNPARARNAGTRRACGAYVAFLDSDDVWESRKLETQLRALHEDGDARWCYTAYRLIDQHGRAVPPRPPRSWVSRSGWILPDVICERLSVAIQTVLLERSLFDEVGGFDEALLHREDYDLILRVAARAPTVAVEEALCRIREHPGRMTRTRDDREEWAARIYRKHMWATTHGPTRRLARRQHIAKLATAAGAAARIRGLRAGASLLRQAVPWGIVSWRWWVGLGRVGIHGIRRLLVGG